MSSQNDEWVTMWGAKVKVNNDMNDDLLKDAIETSRRVFENLLFEKEGKFYKIYKPIYDIYI